MGELITPREFQHRIVEARGKSNFSIRALHVFLRLTLALVQVQVEAGLDVLDSRCFDRAAQAALVLLGCDYNGGGKGAGLPAFESELVQLSQQWQIPLIGTGTRYRRFLTALIELIDERAGLGKLTDSELIGCIRKVVRSEPAA